MTTTISNINIVVQQGDSARSVQNIKNQPLDANQLTINQQQQKETEQQTIVSQTEQPENTKFDGEQIKRRRDLRDRRKKEHEKRRRKQNDSNSNNQEGPGRLLDTVV